MTHSYRATDEILNVSQLKSNIQNILINIKELEALQCETRTLNSNVDRLMQQTDELIKLVEKSPLESIAKKIKKRKQRRKSKKSKLKIKTRLVRKNVLQMPTYIASATIPSYEASARTHTEPASSTNCPTETITKKPHIRFLKQHDVQWNEVFFGPVEYSCYGGARKMADFLRIRRIWDSYLTRSKQGTTIPCGWVLPRENALTEWQQYKATWLFHSTLVAFI